MSADSSFKKFASKGEERGCSSRGHQGSQDSRELCEVFVWFFLR